MSLVGVMIAATIIIATKAWRRYFAKSSELIMPKRDSSKQMMGISKEIPIIIDSIVKVLIYELSDMVLTTAWLTVYVAKNRYDMGKITK